MPAPNAYRPFLVPCAIAYLVVILPVCAGHIGRGEYGALLFWLIVGIVGVDVASG